MSRNSLAASLALYARLRGRRLSEEELLAGLPLTPKADGSLSVAVTEILQKAPERSGFQVLLKKAPLSSISVHVLPVILLLNDGSTCLLTKLNENGDCSLLLPESELTGHSKKIAEIEADYSGYLVYLGDRFEQLQPGHGESGIDRSNHWFWHAIRLCLPVYFDVIIASFIISIFALVSPLFTMNVYDRVVPNNATETLWVLGIGTIVVTFFDSILKFIRTYYIELAARKSDRLISARIFAKILNLRMEEAPRNIGAFASCLREYDSIRNFLTSSVLLVVVDLPFTAILLLVVYYLAGQVVLVPIVMMLAIITYALLVRRPLYKSIAANYEDSARKNSLVVETLGGLSDIKQLNSAGIFQGRWEALVAAIAGKSIVTRIISTSVGNLTGILIQLNTVFTIIVGVYMIRDHQMSMGALIAVMILSSKIIAPVGQLVGLISSWDQTQLSFASLRDVMQKEEENSRQDLISKSSYNGDIEFCDVTFTYPGAEHPALKNFSCKFKQGEKVIILGRMGAGKSTLNRLLMGFFKPQQGRILIDGLDLQELSLAQFRNQVNYVAQDFSLFSGTIRENLLMGAPTADDRAILTAIAISGLAPLLQASPRGLDTHILERGQNLSGGQRQSIALARAFVRDGAIALLDEPTNSMDGNSETQVKNTLRQLLRNKTMLLTTHKHSLLDLAERILVIDAGKLIFDGNQEAFRNAFVKKENSTA